MKYAKELLSATITTISTTTKMGLVHLQTKNVSLQNRRPATGAKRVKEQNEKPVLDIKDFQLNDFS